MKKIHMLFLFLLLRVLYAPDNLYSKDSILLIDDYGYSPSFFSTNYANILTTNGYTYDFSCSTDDHSILVNYDLVIWIGFTLDSQETILLQNYLLNGGKLYISGKYLAYSNPNFIRDYFDVNYLYTSYSYSITGNYNHQISSGINFALSNASIDILAAKENAIPLFFVSNSTYQVAGICYDGNYKLAYLTFNFDNVSLSSVTKEIFSRSINWLEGKKTKLAGYTLDTNNNPVSDVLVSLSGKKNSQFTTGSNGYFEFQELNVGNYTLTPQKNGYKFNPVSFSVSSLSDDNLNLTFTGEIINEVKFQITNSIFNPRNNQKVKITFETPVTTNGYLKLFSLDKNLIKTFFDNEIVGGSYELFWDGKNNENLEVASGLYLLNLCFLNKDGKTINETRKIILVK